MHKCSSSVRQFAKFAVLTACVLRNKINESPWHGHGCVLGAIAGASGSLRMLCTHCKNTLSCTQALAALANVCKGVCLCCRFYRKALSCIPVLRGACIEHKKGQIFNAFLEQTAAKYEHDQLRADFWRRLIDDKISLINSDEASDVETTKQQSEDFLKQHTHQPQVHSQPYTIHLLKLLFSSALADVLPNLQHMMPSSIECNFCCTG